MTHQEGPPPDGLGQSLRIRTTPNGGGGCTLNRESFVGCKHTEEMQCCAGAIRPF